MRVSTLFSYVAGLSTALALSNNLYEINETSGIGEPFINPTGTKFHIYVPASVATANGQGQDFWPPIVVAPHSCGSSGPQIFSTTKYAEYADQYKYIVIYPSAPSPRICWDVSSTESLTHNGGSDSYGIVLMVKWVLHNYKADPNRVYSVGLSSGGMMTQVLMSSYPDIFRAGSAWASVPPGCYTHLDYFGGDLCTTGGVSKSPQQWGDIIRNAFPGYNGPRPRLQIWHGSVDSIISYANFGESIKAWTNLFNINFAGNISNTPITSYTKMTYGDKTQFEAYSAAGVDHVMPYRELDALKWFGIAN